MSVKVTNKDMGSYKQILTGLYLLAPLAYLAAKTRGLTEKAEAILNAAGKTEQDVQLPTENPDLPSIPKPVAQLEDPNWPLLTVSKSFFEGAFIAVDKNGPDATAVPAFSYNDQIENIEEAAGDWGADDEDLGIPGLSSKAPPEEDLYGTPEAGDEEEGEDGGWDLDGDIKADIDAEISQAAAQETAEFVAPTAGTSESVAWPQNSPLAADHVAAGSFESAMQVRSTPFEFKAYG